MTHKQWLDNEYSEWVKALQESTVHNFKEHPVVKRMLGEVDKDLFIYKADTSDEKALPIIWTIDGIGRTNKVGISGTCLRMIYYAQQILKRNPSSICEIGGGVGQFYAILRALGWKGMYSIFDLPEVVDFQIKYLDEVTKQTGLDLKQHFKKQVDPMLVSFYALGEFSDEIKSLYFDNKSPMCIKNFKHGYIVWNPHSGASDDLSLFKHDIKVTPGVEPGIKIVEW